jgi:hypothetical protein
MFRGSDNFAVSQWVASGHWRLEKVERCTKCGVIAIEKAGTRTMRLGSKRESDGGAILEIRKTRIDVSLAAK